MAAPARRAPQPLRGARRPARPHGRGGDRATAPRARLIAGGAAIALAALAGAAGSGASAATAAALLVAAALATGLVTPVFAALVLLGAIFPEGEHAIPAPIYAGVLLLAAELAFWALDERATGRVEPGIGAPRLLGILAVTATGVAAGALVLLAAETETTRSPAATAAGVAAILACVAVLVALAGRTRPQR